MAGFFQFPNMFGNMQGAMNMQGILNFQGASNFQRASNFQMRSNFQGPANFNGGSNYMNMLFLQGAVDAKKKLIAQTPIRSPNDHFYPGFMLREARNELNDLVWCDGSKVWNDIRQKTGIDFLNSSSVEQGWGNTSCEYSHANLGDSILCQADPTEQMLNSSTSDSLYLDNSHSDENSPSSSGTSGQSSPSPSSPTSHPINTSRSTHDHSIDRSTNDDSSLSKGRNSTADTEQHSKNSNSVKTEIKTDCKNSTSIKTETVNDCDTKNGNSIRSSQKRRRSGENKNVQNEHTGPPVKRPHLENDLSSPSQLPWGAPAIPKNSPSVHSVRISGHADQCHDETLSSSQEKHSVIDKGNKLSLSEEQDSGIFSPTSPKPNHDSFSSPVLKNKQISTSTPYYRR